MKYVSIALVLFSVLGVTPSSIAAQTPKPASSWPANCAGPNGEYSRGAVLLNGGVRYNCVNLRNKDWASQGVTWVRVEMLGNDFVLSRPSAPDSCERSNNGEYSPGATLNLFGEVARCATVFDEKLNPAGSAWVDVRLIRDDFFSPRIH